MKNITKYFPGTLEAKKDVVHLLVVIALYLLASFVAGMILGILQGFPILGILVKIIKFVVSVYLDLGIIVALLAFLKIVD